jgi:predicted O-linked N-acetylglucosamine transferase (SPINDLY family)
MTELSVPQLLETAQRCRVAGDLGRASALCYQALTHQPECAPALHMLALISAQASEPEKARAFIERAIVANPIAPEYRSDYGVILESQNKTDEAITAYLMALEVQRDFVQAHINLGYLLQKQNRFNEAASAFRAAVEIRTDDPQLHNSLGAALYQSGQIEPALLEFSTAIELRPDFADAYNNAGNALFSRGDPDLAIVAYRKAVELDPQLAAARINLAGALDRQGRRDEAAAAHRDLASAKPDDLAAQLSAGNAFAAMGFWDAAAEALARAAALDLRNGAILTKLGNAQLARLDLGAAVAAYRKALDLAPPTVELFNNLGVALKEQGLLDDAMDCCESAMDLDPSNAAVHSNLVYLLQFHPGYDPAELSRQQNKWNRLHAEPLKNLIYPHPNSPDPDRRLKLAYLSPDFRQHVVGQNISPLLAEHDRRHFEVFCYSTTQTPDAVTAMLRRQADVWRDVAAEDDESLAALIRRDAIDILVDLSLHMAHNRLLVFARKPAPVQATYLGYCGSTGLQTIDYRLSDIHLDGPESDTSLYSEETIRLPETWWCYTPAGPTPPPAPCAAPAAGFVTFGCLNNFAKVSPAALDLWAEILLAVPASRLLLHSHAGPHHAAVRARFAAAGVSADRIDFLPKQPWSHYLQTYARIDIALDPFPYAGGITTCDALWMGVPVVTLASQTAVGRGGKSILSNLALPELIARRPRQYVQIAVTLANSPARLAELRTTLREKMLTSPLMNARKFTRNVENAYRQMWRRWCESPKFAASTKSDILHDRHGS